MALDPISVELTDFQKLEILREEEERLAEELADVEQQLRDRLLTAARRQYLMSLSPYYAAATGEEPGPAPGELEARREMVGATLATVETQRQQYETALGVPAARAGRPAARRGGAASSGTARKGRFENFEDFRQSQPSG